MSLVRSPVKTHHRITNCCPKILHQPCSLLGRDEMGLSELVEFVLAKYPAEVQTEMTKNIFVHGGVSLLPNFKVYRCLNIE